MAEINLQIRLEEYYKQVAFHAKEITEYLAKIEELITLVQLTRGIEQKEKPLVQEALTENYIDNYFNV